MPQRDIDFLPRASLTGGSSHFRRHAIREPRSARRGIFRPGHFTQGAGFTEIDMAFCPAGNPPRVLLSRRSMLIGAATAAASLGTAQAADEPALVEHVESLYNDISLYKRNDGYFMLMFGARRRNYI